MASRRSPPPHTHSHKMPYAFVKREVDGTTSHWTPPPPNPLHANPLNTQMSMHTLPPIIVRTLAGIWSLSECKS